MVGFLCFLYSELSGIWSNAQSFLKTAPRLTCLSLLYCLFEIYHLNFASLFYLRESDIRHHIISVSIVYK